MPQSEPFVGGLVHWCSSPKTWCRILCLLSTLVHGILYAVMASYVLFGVDLYTEFPVLGVVRWILKREREREGEDVWEKIPEKFKILFFWNEIQV